MTPLSTIGPGPDEPLDAVDERRRQVVEVAAQLLGEDGPHGLSLRRVAERAGASTQIVYTLFGGKPGLGDALYREGFRRLGRSMSQALAEAPPAGDPARLLALGHGYRRFATAEPDFFSVMFGRSVPGFTPSRETRFAGREQTLGQVVQAAAECLAAGTLVAPSAEQLARACWVTAHGLASLQVAGLLLVADVDAFADVVLRGPLDAHRPTGQDGPVPARAAPPSAGQERSRRIGSAGPHRSPG